VKSDLLRLRLIQSVAAAGPITTLVVNPWGNFDPISVVKMLALSTVAFLILALIFLSRKRIDWQEQQPLILSASFFVGWMFMVMLFSGAPLNQQFWGTFGRNTGFLTYVSLTAVLMGAALIREVEGYRKITDYLLIFSIPMTLYCLVQMSGNDPIEWSYQSTFGTLGNVNFLSAFMGLVTVTAFSYCLSYTKSNPSKVPLLLLLIVVDLVIVASTGSIQGLMIFGAGVVIVVFLWLRSVKYYRLTQPIFAFFMIVVAVPVVMGILNYGPLSRFLFQNSTKLRGDYIHAGWEMTTRFPIFGVGMDSYGDWYRETRGEISTEAGIDRIANTAHNIFLDISSNGGFPLLAGYLAMLILASMSAFRVYKNLNGKYDPVFSALLAAWIAYQVQALISINQIGVGVWGWIFTGALIGYRAATAPRDTSLNSSVARKNLKGQLLPAGAGLVSIAGATLGFLLAWFPVKADADYISAIRTRSLETIIPATRLFGSTPWHSELALNEALLIPAPPQAKEIATYLVKNYPRSNFGWKAIYYSELSTPEERELALSKLRQLDPFYPEWRW